MNIFLDTDVLVDALTKREPYYQSVSKLLLCGAVGEFTLWTSSSQIASLFYLLSDGANPTLIDESKRRIKRLREHVNLCTLSDSEFDRALNSTWEDIENACTYQAALKIKADYIVTRNEAEFEKSSIPALNADAFFEVLREEKGLIYEEITP